MAVVAEALDLSRLPAPVLIPINFEEDLAARIARLKEIFDAAAIPYDVEKLLTDPAGCLQEADNYRESLAKVAVNETYKRTLIAFAEKASLDWWGVSFLGLLRMAGETDIRYRTRLILEFENKSGGRLSGYKTEALRASIDVADAGVWVDRSNPLQPVIRIAIMVASAAKWVVDPAQAVGTARLIRDAGGSTGAASSALVAAVQKHIDQEHVKQGTDVIVVQSVSVRETAVAYIVEHRSGPDPTLLRTSSAKATADMVDRRHTPGRDLPRPAITAAGFVGGVEQLSITVPALDLIIPQSDLVFVTSITVGSAYTDG